MKLQPLEKHIARLASLPESKKLVVSCYLNLEKPESDWRTFIPKREEEIMNTIASTQMKSIVLSAFSEIKTWLNTNLSSSSKGVALFARGGREFFIPMQFVIPLPNEISIDTVPHLYNLVRMSDSFHQYIVLYSDARDARIYEVNLGQISEQLLFEHPEVRARLSRESTKLHFQRQRRENNSQFLEQKLEVLERLFTEDNRAHLILAGDSTYISQIAKALSPRLAERLVDQIEMSKPNSIERILAETLKVYVQAEERESLNTVDRLLRAFHRGDLAVLGVLGSLKATLRGEADTLVLAHDCDLGTAYICPKCDWVAIGKPTPKSCAECGVESLIIRDARQELVRQAQASACEIETVAKSKELETAGGAGCLLRYSHSIPNQLRSLGAS